MFLRGGSAVLGQLNPIHKKGPERFLRYLDLGAFNGSMILLHIRRFFFRHQGFLLPILTIHRTAGEGSGSSFFLSTTSTHSWTSRYLFATMQMKWLLRIFSRIACNYQTASRWDLPSWGINIWLIDDEILISIYLMV